LSLGEVERRAAVGAEARGAPGLPVAAPTDRLAALGAEPLVLGDDGILQDSAGGVDLGDRRHRRDAGPDPGGPHPARLPGDPAGRDGAAAGARGAEGGGLQPAGDSRHGRAGRRDGALGTRLGSPADVAVAVDDPAVTTRLATRRARNANGSRCGSGPRRRLAPRRSGRRRRAGLGRWSSRPPPARAGWPTATARGVGEFSPVPGAPGIPQTSQYPSVMVPVHPGC
jgi:hypothetical protein